MPPVSERALEIKVGALILTALGLLVGFVLVLGNFSLGPTFEIYVDFGFSGAVHEGAPVKVSGVQLGRVDKVDFLGGKVRDARGVPVMVRLTLSLEERAREVVREDSDFFINTQGVLGEPYLEIVPGDLRGEILPPGTVVRGVDPPRTDLLLARAFTLLAGLARALGDNEDVIGDLLSAGSGLATTLDEVLQENRENLGKALENVVLAAADLRRMAGIVASRLDEGGDIDLLVKDVREAIAEMREAIGVLRRDLPPLLADARAGMAELSRLSTISGELTAEDLQSVTRAIAHYEKVGAQLEDLTKDLGEIVDGVERGKGTIGALLQDDQIYDDLKELMSDLKQHPWKVVWKE